MGEMRVRFLAEPRNGGEGPWIMEERGVASGNREVLTLRGHPSLDPSSASATVVIVKGILDSKELVV